jgi:hypothetical protein
LPDVVDGWHVAWDDANPFRRGLASVVRVRDLYTFLDVAPRLFDSAPVSDLILPTAPLDVWRQFAKSPWLPRVKSVRFAGLSTPIEPIRCLCESPFATGLEEIHFDRANSPAMPELVAGLAASPLRTQLRGINLRMGDENTMDLIAAFGRESWPRLEKLSFVAMGIDGVVLTQLRDVGLLDGLLELDLSDNPQDNYLFRVLGSSNLPDHLTSFTARRLNYEVLYRVPAETDRAFIHCRRLDLGETIGLDDIEIAAIEQWFPNLRALGLSHTNPGDDSLVRIIESPIWPQLVELDLTRNTFLRAGLERFLTAVMPPDLAWIGLSDRSRDPDLGEALDRKFEGRTTPRPA